MKVIFERVKLRPPYLTLKGGSWRNLARQNCRADIHDDFVPGLRFNFLGFRPLIRIRRLE